MASKAAVYNALLSRQIRFSSDRQYFRQRLDPFLVLQFLAGPREQRATALGLSLRLVTWLTLVGAPAAIILFAQLTFLPFHLQWLQWLLRLILLADIAIAALFWRRIRIASKPTIARLLRATAAAIVALALLLFSMCIATYPGEWTNENLRSVAMIPTSANPKWSDDRGWTSLHTVLFSGAADEVTGKPGSLLSNRLILTNQSFVDSGKLGALEISQRFRGRDLHDAIFIGADLRKADFTGSILINADFSYAKLQQAQFSCASEGYKDPEDLFGGDKQLCSDLRGAKLEYAELAGTLFQNVRIQGVTFLFAKLYGAKFSLVDAGGASFNFAELQGASLEGDFKGGLIFPSQSYRSRFARRRVYGGAVQSVLATRSVNRER